MAEFAMRKLLALALIVAGCATTPPVAPGPDWNVFRARGPYTLHIPPGMVEIAMTPIDSAADHLQTDGLRFNLDYGRYGCGVMGRNPGDVHSVTTAVIDGRRAEIDRYTTEPNDIGEFRDRLYAQIPHAGENCLAVNAMCRTGHDCDLARAIITTIDFDPPG
jgi:hypothetical protein